ncbi:MAG: glycerophosphodiester phosphodiesterase family protein [Bacteroidota bacterium]
MKNTDEVKKILRVTSVWLLSISAVYGQSQNTQAAGCEKGKSKHCKLVRALDSPQQTSNDVFITAHRGLWGDLPETTIASTREAQQEGWKIIEVDVMRTKDDELLLMHDQQINRMSGQKTREYASGSSQDKPGNATWVRNLNYHSNTQNVPNRQNQKGTLGALKKMPLKNKWGTKLSGDHNKFRTASNLFPELRQWDGVLLALDIKDKNLEDYKWTTSQLLKLGKEKGVLTRLLFKPGSGIAGITYDDLSDYLKDQGTYSDFQNKVTVALIVQPESFGSGNEFKKYMQPWMDNLPSLALVETIYKNDNDFLLKSSSQLGGQSPVDWIKSFGYRTGVFWDNATDCRGVTDGRGHWFTPDDKNFTDYRGSMEWLLNKKPGMIVTDRPDVTRSFLQLFNQYNSLSFK